MHALLIEVNNTTADNDAAKASIEKGAIPMSQAAGGRSGVWLAPADGVGVAVIAFETEAEATAMAANITVGAQPPGAPDGVTFKSVSVREILASY